jgi:ABC-type sugar transport system ATPase subunit
MKAEILNVRELSVTDHSRRSVHNLSFLVRKGECVILCGRNYASVEVICNLFHGRGRVTAGEVTVSGSPLQKYTQEEMMNHHIFVLTDTPPLIDSLNVGECLFLLKRNSLRKMVINWKAIRIQTDHILKQFELPFSSETKIAELDKADRQIIALLWALNQGARILILQNFERDMTESEIDRVKQVLMIILASGVAVLVGAYHPEHYYSLASRMLILQHGEITRKVLDPERFSESYLQNDENAVFPEIGMKMKSDDPKHKDMHFEGIQMDPSHPLPLSMRTGGKTLLVTADSALQDRIWKQLNIAENGGAQLYFGTERVACHSVEDLLKCRIVMWASGSPADISIDNLSLGDNILLPVFQRISDGLFYEANAKEICNDADFFGNPINRQLPSPQERLGIIRMLTQRWKLFNPRLVMMLNVFSNADAESGEVLLQFVRELSERGTCILLMETEAKYCAPLCDQILQINHDFEIQTMSAQEFALQHKSTGGVDALRQSYEG